VNDQTGLRQQRLADQDGVGFFDARILAPAVRRASGFPVGMKALDSFLAAPGFQDYGRNLYGSC
jgi:hypothetical protein